jgi:hypothetical protein
VRYKWLLLARLLFLLLLIFAFAQPFFVSKSESKRNIVAIFVDNSQSMSLKIGQRTLLDIAKENVLKLVQSNPNRFLILTNDKPISYKSFTQQQALNIIPSIQLSANSKTSTQVFSELEGMLQENELKEIDFYYVSDFQKQQFGTELGVPLLSKINFNGVQIRQAKPQNTYIDTAYFETPVIQTGQSNRLIVRTKYFGEEPRKNIVLQLTVDGLVKSAATPNFNQQKESYDTLSFQTNDNQWQSLLLTINDAQVHFDDSFAIAARSVSELPVLVINEGLPNVFLQAALRSYNGFKVVEQNTMPADISGYNLIVVNALTTLSDDLSSAVLKALQDGQNVVFFLGENANIESINKGFQKIIDIKITGFDTSAQTVSTVQSENQLIKSMFERIPENVQLPFTKSHYQIKAGLGASQQSVFSFRNGDPFFALYSAYKGQLYLCSTTPNERNGNFQSSYFFVPFLYQMASQASGSSIFAVTAGQKTPVFVNQSSKNEQPLLHLKGKGLDAIPAQRAEGMGVQVFVGAAVQHFGFYSLSATVQDSTLIAVNMNRSESDLSVFSMSDLKKMGQGKNINWQLADVEKKILTTNEQSAFPLWKLCVILALLMLGFETYFLSKNLQKQKPITT